MHTVHPDCTMLSQTHHRRTLKLTTDQCCVQIWFELYRPPSPREVELLEEVLASWFMMGRLGAYNAQNLQVNQVSFLFTKLLTPFCA